MAEDLQIRIPVTLGMENIPEEVKKILQEGTTKAQNEAKENMKNIKKHMMIDYDLN